MEFLNNGRERKPFVYQMIEGVCQDWVIHVNSGNTAYRHELNAMIMALEQCLLVGAWQESDDDGKVYWRLW